MLGADEFISSPPRKTVRFGGTLSDILLKYEKGDTTDFELLKHQLSDPDIKDAQIINWLHEFRTSVAYLTKELEQLVNILLKLPWLRRSREVVEEYLGFLGNLVSAQTVHLRPCLRMIVSQFVPPRITIREDDVDISDSDDDDENLSENFNTCHRALQTVARYVPSTPQFLMPILVEYFPFINKSERTLECYVHNLLRVTVYLPTLRLQILELIIEKLLKLDVSTPQQDIEDAEETANNSGSEEKSTEEGLFDMEEDEERKGSTVVSGSSERMAHPLAERLDILMTILFSYIKDVCHVDGKLNINTTKDLYRDLVSVFDKLILPTHASCHVQYFMFYICSFKLGLAEAFLDHLWKKLQDPNNPSVIRQTAGSYIGSFLARAKFIPVVTVKACLDLLVNWMHKYIDNQDTGTNAFCDVALHGPFYSTCQAVFYTLIFRHKQLLDGNLRKGLSYLQSLNFERIVMCQLNPLKICIPSVVNLFAAITRKYQLVFCYTIIERNNRQLIPVVRSGTGGDLVQTCTNPLDSFFPFDPYILKRSKKTIDPLYQFWEELSAEDLENLKKPIKKGISEDEDDDFLKGETPQNDGVVGIAAHSYESNTRSPEKAKLLRSQPAQTVEPKGLLYVQQREFAVTTPKDGSVSILGSDDATTCHIVVLRHTGAFDLQPDDVHLVTFCVTELNDREEQDIHFPIIYGIAVNVKTAEIFPATFPEKGPDEDLRSAHVLTGAPLTNIYDAKTEQLRIGPYFWGPFPHVDFWLEQDDAQILQNLSTSPLAEPPHFVSHIRSTLTFLKAHPFPSRSLFPDRRPRIYKKNEEGLWEKVCSDKI
ncbi:RNA polymerase I-specific transcription initiation factor RRN3 [Willisornis vidua]|uniref:RNA polymerase I-specific transcription initiation factor RRN3 n=1 Tax=Willisornis vidua TaxID=1566151 RepID=A0ABQ9D7W1_9PASS|nr:RNA polymerase I-specific transcription initiation factor RRN3 [Willisornis vidua]